MTKKGVQFNLFNPKKQKSAGLITVIFSRKYELFDFTEYLGGGLELNLITCIDFTGSNGDKNMPSSLHYVNPNYPNMYQQALSSVCQIVLKYSKGKAVPTYGFGAGVGFQGFNPSLTSHFFPCSGSWQNCAGRGIEGVYSLYNHALMNCTFSGPTYFSPMINEIIKFTLRSSPYNLLNPQQSKKKINIF